MILFSTNLHYSLGYADLFSTLTVLKQTTTSQIHNNGHNGLGGARMLFIPAACMNGFSILINNNYELQVKIKLT